MACAKLWLDCVITFYARAKCILQDLGDKLMDSLWNGPLAPGNGEWLEIISASSLWIIALLISINLLSASPRTHFEANHIVLTWKTWTSCNQILIDLGYGTGLLSNNSKPSPDIIIMYPRHNHHQIYTFSVLVLSICFTISTSWICKLQIHMYDTFVMINLYGGCIWTVSPIWCQAICSHHDYVI